ncbi:ribonuclease P [Methanobacterium sp. VT]|uniref:Ribonuclease P protein component 4 n=2 Tax=Methanobacterium spitsbergense TaxID=2874285 RepID=A0A8T5V280_9EURY|nr:ribonuclease P protein component 4 [Methanobacterium spitsbergense]MBZ2165971.1 ribonuclease P [Methanobacterium spitsbergense]
MRRGRRPKWMLKIAEERIDILFNKADDELTRHPERSNRYVEMARNIAKKYNMKMSSKWSKRFCHSCYHFMKPGLNCQIRLSDSSVVIKCLECGNINKIPYMKEKKERRRRKIEYNNTSKKGINEQIIINNHHKHRKIKNK